MSKFPKVSIIMPIFNAEKYIEHSLRTVFCQTFNDLEFIFVNDCSADKSVLILEKVLIDYPEREAQVKLINNLTNKGSAASRAIGVDNAIADYIIHVDSDDYCELNMIESLYNHAIFNHAEIVICDYYVNYPNRQLYISQQQQTDSLGYVKALMDGRLHGATWNKLIKRSIYVDNSVNFTPGLNLWEDLSTVLQLCYFARKICYLPKAFLHYNQLNTTSYTNLLTDVSLNNIVDAVTVIEIFLKRMLLLPQLDYQLMCLKLNAKRELLLHTRGRKQKELSGIYPETNPSIFKHKVNPLYYRLALWLISKRFFLLANALFNLIQISRKIKRI